MIKEKYSDPSNQTVVYICENVSQRHKSNSRDNSRLEQRQSFVETSRNCEVSLDNSRGEHSRNMIGGDGLDNSRDVQFDFPRNVAEGDVSRDSDNVKLEKNFFVYPSIHETCIRYSKDILQMLNNHSAQEKQTMSMLLSPLNDDDKDTPSTYYISADEVVENLSKDNIDNKKLDVELEEVKVVKDDSGKGEERSGFLSQSLSKCERYFLEMFRDKCKAQTEVEGVDSEEIYLKKICNGKCQNISQYANVSYKSNASQTGYSQLDKKTQTTQTNLLSCDSTYDQSFLSDEIPRILPKENDIFDNSQYLQKDDDVSQDISEERHQNERNLPQDVWNQTNVRSGEISFEEAEMAAYSTPFYEEVTPFYPPESLHPRNLNEPPQEEGFEEPKLFRAENHRFHHIPHKIPLVPLRHYMVPPPHIKQNKILSPRTLRKIPNPRIHYPEVPLAIRSRSLPVCTEVYASRHDLHKPVRLHKIRRSPNCPEELVDVAFVMEDPNFVKKIAPSELRGFVELSPNIKANCGGRKLTQKEYFERWSKMNNSY